MFGSVRKTAHDAREIRKGVLPCIAEEIAPDYLKWITALGIVVIMKFSKRVNVPLVRVFEALFIPIGLRAHATNPLLNAALYLITVGAGSAPKPPARAIKPYRREDEGHGSYRHRGEMFLESHTVVILALEP